MAGRKEDDSIVDDEVAIVFFFGGSVLCNGHAIGSLASLST